MAAVSDGAHSVVVWVLGLFAVVIIAGGAQWFMPERTTQPIADRFLCPGRALVTPAAATSESDVFSKVECIEGVRRDDVSLMAFVILTIPAALIVAAGTVLSQRVLTPKPKTRRVQRASTT